MANHLTSIFPVYCRSALMCFAVVAVIVCAAGSTRAGPVSIAVIGDYGIADISTFPWAARHEWQGIALDEFPNVKRWYEAVDARPGVQRGLAAQLPG